MESLQSSGGAREASGGNVSWFESPVAFQAEKSGEGSGAEGPAVPSPKV